jgi:hypothetical protein
LAQQGQQIVLPDPSVIDASAGSAVAFALRYDVSDGDNGLTGFGVRMYWDSRKLDFIGLSDILKASLLGAETSCHPDTNNKDGDATTDCFVNTAWFDIGSNWPGQSLPVTLYQANFVSHLTAGARTQVNFSGGSTTASGYSFQGTPVTLIGAMPSGS